MGALLIRERRPDGTLGDFKKVFSGETEEERKERIEIENAQIVYDAMMKDLKLTEMSQFQAELMYQLMSKGVI